MVNDNASVPHPPLFQASGQDEQCDQGPTGDLARTGALMGQDAYNVSAWDGPADETARVCVRDASGVDGPPKGFFPSDGGTSGGQEPLLQGIAQGAPLPVHSWR